MFIGNGLKYIFGKSKHQPLRILEMGFGTGLNMLLTLFAAQKQGREVDYTGVEAYPPEFNEISQLNYSSCIPELTDEIFSAVHKQEWNVPVRIDEHFQLTKLRCRFEALELGDSFDLIYFVQPELWTEDIFQKMYDALNPEGVLVTYSSKGSVKRCLVDIGFEIERLKGPPGKRHMLRATKH